MKKEEEKKTEQTSAPTLEQKEEEYIERVSKLASRQMKRLNTLLKEHETADHDGNLCAMMRIGVASQILIELGLSGPEEMRMIVQQLMRAQLASALKEKIAKELGAKAEDLELKIIALGPIAPEPEAKAEEDELMSFFDKHDIVMH